MVLESPEGFLEDLLSYTTCNEIYQQPMRVTKKLDLKNAQPYYGRYNCIRQYGCGL